MAQDIDSTDILEEKPKIFLMGLKGGKSSIQKVVLHKMVPAETLFLEITNKIERSVWDFPGHIDFCDPIFQSDEIFTGSCAIIFVIDAQDDYLPALQKLNLTVENAYKKNPNIKYEVFIHKVDGLIDDQMVEIQRDITQRVTNIIDDFLFTHGGGEQSDDSTAPGISIGFHLTTIYDHSIFEAFSKVVQKLIPYLDAYEDLLSIFLSSSNLDKAFLIDVASKIYLATDSTVVDMQIYEQCCNMIDVVANVSSLYTPPAELTDPPFSEHTSATIVLNNDTVLYLRGINRYMALVCLLRKESLDKTGIIEFNYQIVKKGIQRLLSANQANVQALRLSRGRANKLADNGGTAT